MQETDTAKPADGVNHPAHYNAGGIEAIDVIEAWGLGFCLGNVVKYIARAGRKPGATPLQDLKKSQWYLSREIDTRQGDKVPLVSIPDVPTSPAKMEVGTAELEQLTEYASQVLQLKEEIQQWKDAAKREADKAHATSKLYLELGGKYDALVTKYADAAGAVELQGEGYPLAQACADAIVNEAISLGYLRGAETQVTVQQIAKKYCSRYFANAQDTSDKLARAYGELATLRSRSNQGVLQGLRQALGLVKAHARKDPADGPAFVDARVIVAIEQLIQMNTGGADVVPVDVELGGT